MTTNVQRRKADFQSEAISGKRWLLTKFLFTILITLIFCISLVYVFISNWITPASIPEVPFANIPSVKNERPVSSQYEIKPKEESAFLVPEGDMEDTLIGGGLHAPEGFTTDDRKEQFYTFLIVGLDEGFNTDTIIVASYDGLKQKANLISIPRDTLVNVKRPLKKINAAYPVGARNGDKSEGMAQLQREIKTIIGFVPDFFLLVNFSAFTELVDAIGGVDVEADINMVYDDPVQNLHINIPKGQQHLDGINALRFARYRKGGSGYRTLSDYERIENQQKVIKAVLTQLLKPENILKVPEFIEIFNNNVFSNLDSGNILWFAGEINKIKGTDALSAFTIPTAGTSGEPSYYEYLDKDGVIRLVNETINPYIKDIEAKDVDIINYE